MKTVVCPHCNLESQFGASECAGCQAKFFYNSPLMQAIGYGLGYAGMSGTLAIIIMFFIPHELRPLVLAVLMGLGFAVGWVRFWKYENHGEDYV